MSDIERIMKLRKLASDLDIRLHVISMDLEKESEIQAPQVEKLLGIDVIDSLVPHNQYRIWLTEVPHE